MRATIRCQRNSSPPSICLKLTLGVKEHLHDLGAVNVLASALALQIVIQP